jgi:hypothetical protein
MKSKSLLTSVATSLGCLGICFFSYGGLTLIVSLPLISGSNSGADSDLGLGLIAGVGSICGGFLYISISAIVWYLYFDMRKKTETVEPSVPTE